MNCLFFGEKKLHRVFIIPIVDKKRVSKETTLRGEVKKHQPFQLIWIRERGNSHPQFKIFD